MRSLTTTTTLADRLDLQFMGSFGPMSVVSLSVTWLIALSVLTGWQSAEIRQVLPEGWWLMQASTALTILLLALGLLFPHRRQSRLRLARPTCGGLAMALAAMGPLEIWGGQPAEYGSFLVDESLLALVQPVASQSALCFLLLGATLLIEPSRRGWAGALIDAALMLLAILNLVFISAYLFDAGLLVGLSEDICISPQTLTCIALLTFVLAGQRAPFGFLAALVGDGLGSRLARRLLPMAVVISFLTILGGERLQASGLLSLPNAEAVTATFTAVLMVTVVLQLARRINHLEQGLRDVSLTDELTGVHNLRGFYHLAAQALRDAGLQKRPTMLMFFDIDGLKQVNDTQGHEIGSQLLKEFAALLKETFRGSDIVGRVGGDEFAVITSGRRQDSTSALRRLNEKAAAANRIDRRPYLLSFSVGMEFVDPRHNLPLRELMANADAAMYRHKRRKRSGQEMGAEVLRRPACNAGDRA